MHEVAEHLQKQTESLPHKPGVYLMHDVDDNVIYVGKTVDLRNRVRSYFHASAQEHPKTRVLIGEIADLEFIVTDSELEALILEATLIKEHRPRYNVRFKDDKRYPYIKATLADPYPKVTITRRIEQDGSRYFGPYTSSSAVRDTLDLLRRSFPYLTCNREITGQDRRPCLYYEIKRCLGPCIGAVSQDAYRAMIDGLVSFLEGRGEQVIADLERRMNSAATGWDFEQAASLRDQLKAVQSIVSKQKIVSVAGADQDVIAFAREEDDACVQVFFIRGGKLLGREYFVLEGTREEDDCQVMTAFLKQFYEEAAYVPPEVLLPSQIDEALIIESWLRGKRGEKVALRVPRRGRKRDLVKMAAENAAEMLAALRVQWQADAHKQEQALAELEEALDLPRTPARIECYDISTIQGRDTVGSMVVMEDGVPRPSDYRRFKVREVGGQDDFAAMEEVLRRRLRNYVAERERPVEERGKFAYPPSLLLVDGGMGQVSRAVKVTEELGLDIPVAGLAKRMEEVYLPGRAEPLRIERGEEALYLLQRIRDEAHRFAVSYHRSLRGRRMVDSVLDAVPGVGPARKKALLRRFGSLKRIREAGVEELGEVVPAAVARRLHASLHEPASPSRGKV